MTAIVTPPLTATEVQKAQSAVKPCHLFGGHRLCLLIKSNTNKYRRCYYQVKFDASPHEKIQGQEELPVCLVNSYGDDVYGFHFPLIQLTEYGSEMQLNLGHNVEVTENVLITLDYINK